MIGIESNVKLTPMTTRPIVAMGIGPVDRHVHRVQRHAVIAVAQRRESITGVEVEGGILEVVPGRPARLLPMNPAVPDVTAVLIRAVVLAPVTTVDEGGKGRTAVAALTSIKSIN